MYTLNQAKDLVINQGYAIKNDDSVEKLREVLKYCFPLDYSVPIGAYKYYIQDYEILSKWDCFKTCNGNSINLSQIELPKQITIEMVIELRKQHPNNLEFGDKLDVLFGGMK